MLSGSCKLHLLFLVDICHDIFSVEPDTYPVWSTLPSDVLPHSPCCLLTLSCHLTLSLQIHSLCLRMIWTLPLLVCTVFVFPWLRIPLHHNVSCHILNFCAFSQRRPYYEIAWDSREFILICNAMWRLHPANPIASNGSGELIVLVVFPVTTRQRCRQEMRWCSRAEKQEKNS